MNDPFQQHGVTHLSASSINTFIQNPAKFILDVSGYKDNIGIPAMWRGIAIDFAICALLQNECSISDVLPIAQNKFIDLQDVSREKGEPVNETKLRQEYESLAKFIEISVPHFQSLGKPSSTQEKIKIDLEDIPVPIIGYTDLQYPDAIHDIKTTGRWGPMKDGTLRQMAIYEKATGKAAFLDYLYVTRTTAEVRPVPATDTDYHYSVVLQACKAIMKLLGTSPDISEVASHLMPDFDRWDMSLGQKEAAKKLWRIS